MHPPRERLAILIEQTVEQIEKGERELVFPRLVWHTAGFGTTALLMETWGMK